MAKVLEQKEHVTIRFAGDSGDGMQLTGTQFTHTAALLGNDLATFPDFPAEIRAPIGTLAGVSGFQVHFASERVFTPGDTPDVLVAMNPAALRVNLKDLREGGALIINTQPFSNAKNLAQAGYAANPLEDGSLSAYRVYPVDITTMTLTAIADVGLNQRAATRCKNFFALGLVYWMFNRSLDHTTRWIDEKQRKKDPLVADANIKALKAGYHYGETAEIFTHHYVVSPAPIKQGLYRNVTGNEALSLGLMAAAELSGLELFLGSYPITPASDVLHFLAQQKAYGVKTFQAEDEIAAVCAALGASYAGGLAVTTTSGPGMALKAEAIGLALMMELPLIICNIQRGGPSTGLPTKTEQSDLLQGLFGRNGESPIPVIAAQSPSDCFWAAIEAARVALRHMTPVLLLSDGYIANGAEPWLIPQMSEIPRIERRFALPQEGAPFKPYARDEDLGRPWAVPGTPGLEHRLGGLEKQHETGAVSYDAANHEFMVKLRAEKVARVARHIAPTEVAGAPSGEAVFVSWGGTFGAVRAATNALVSSGRRVGHIHLRHLSPLPADLAGLLEGFERVVVPELNLGQLVLLLRALLPAAVAARVESAPKVQGRPFKVGELLALVVGAEEARALSSSHAPEPDEPARAAGEGDALVQITESSR